MNRTRRSKVVRVVKRRRAVRFGIIGDDDEDWMIGQPSATVVEIKGSK